MLKYFSLLLCSLATSWQTSAQSPTWSDDVASIIYNNCSNCHHEGGIGPFALMSYEDAFNNALSIKAQVESGLMPPWKPDPDYMHFKDERILSETDISTISNWVAAGAPSGDLSMAPLPPTFTVGSALPTIDLALQTPSYTVPVDEDDYRTFVIHSNFSQDVFLNQIEYMPGNGSIVHHIVIFYDPTNYSWNLDQADTVPGYESYGVGPINNSADIIGAWAPGSAVFTLPENMGIRIPAGADFGVEVHYAPGSNGLTDVSTVNLKYTDASQQNIREVFVDGILNHFDNLTDGPLFIPANTIQTFHEKFDWEFGDMSLISIFPHMHLVGESFKVWSLDENSDTTHLISIPNWNFHWQGFYDYQKPVHITDPSELWAEATYDNTTSNPDNPSNPPEDVYAGEHTTDEMMIVFFTWLPYEPGDENLILDSSLVTAVSDIKRGGDIVKIYPNPVKDELFIYTDFSQPGAVIFELFNATGVLVKHWQEMGSKEKITTTSLQNIPSGIYLLKAYSAEGAHFAKVMKQ